MGTAAVAAAWCGFSALAAGPAPAAGPGEAAAFFDGLLEKGLLSAPRADSPRLAGIVTASARPSGRWPPPAWSPAWRPDHPVCLRGDFRSPGEAVPRGYLEALCSGAAFLPGAADEAGLHAVENVCTLHDLHATMLHLLGLDHTRLTHRFGGRDFRLTDVHGRVVKEIIAGWGVRGRRRGEAG
jgi:hypothetical protein